MRFITADKVFNGRHFLPSGTVLVFNNDTSFKESIDGSQLDSGKAERFRGTICPGFVNAHCHLELSHLKGKIPRHTGLPVFAREIISKRGISPETHEHMMYQADHEMYENGVVAVGDICNTAASIKVKQQSRLFYHSFNELIGLTPSRSDAVFNKGRELLSEFETAGLSASLSPHAPYSSSVELIELIAQYNILNRAPFSIHNQESHEENKFFYGSKSGFNDLYDFLNIDISWFKAPGTSSLKYYGGLLPKGSILVHNTFTAKEDVDAVNFKNIFWCFCPAANLFIENCLPDYSLFTEFKNKLCIGTDSLASNKELNPVSEINHLLKAFAYFSEEDFLAMLTINGAYALGLENEFGQLIPGKKSGLNLVNFTSSELQFIRKIC